MKMFKLNEKAKSNNAVILQRTDLIKGCGDMELEQLELRYFKLHPELERMELVLFKTGMPHDLHVKVLQNKIDNVRELIESELMKHQLEATGVVTFYSEEMIFISKPNVAL